MINAQATKMIRLIDAPRAAATTVASATFDVLGADYAQIVVGFSSELNTSNAGPVLSLSAADTSNATNFVTLAADITTDTTAAKGYVYLVDLKLKPRYLKLSITPDTTTNGPSAYSAIALLSRLEAAPSSTTGMVWTTTDPVTIVT